MIPQVIYFRVSIDGLIGGGLCWSVPLVTRQYTPLGIHSLIQTHAHSVVVTNLRVKVTLHVAVRAKRLFDVANVTVLGPQLHGLEPVDVLGVVEHVAHHRSTLVHLVRHASEHNLLDDQSIGVRAQQRTRCQQFTVVAEYEHGQGWE
jgi:hypothetical protein